MFAKFFHLMLNMYFGISNPESQFSISNVANILATITKLFGFVYCQISKNLITVSTYIPVEMYEPAQTHYSNFIDYVSYLNGLLVPRNNNMQF